MKRLMVIIVLIVSGCTQQELAELSMLRGDYNGAASWYGAGTVQQTAAQQQTMDWILNSGPSYQSVNVGGQRYNCQTIGSITTCF